MATPIVAGQHSAANPSNESAQTVDVASRAREHGLTVERRRRFDVYTGTAEQLIAAELVQPGMFPGDPGRGLTMVSYAEDGTQIPRGNSRFQTSLRVQKMGKKFTVTVYVSDAERARRAADEEARSPEAEESRAKAEAEVRRQELYLSELPSTAEAYRRRAAAQFWTAFQIFYDEHCTSEPTESGYRFSRADAKEFHDLAERLFYDIYWTEPVFSQAARLKKLNEARSKAAKADPRLQGFIRHAVANPLHEPIEEDRPS